MTKIPPRQTKVDDKERRFYISAPSSVYLQLQQEAIQRGTDLWTLGGAVLALWLKAGCPDLTAQHSGSRSDRRWCRVGGWTPAQNLRPERF